MILALILDTATPVVAAAAPPVEALTVTVGPGVAWGYVTGDNLAPGATAQLQADVGYRSDENAALVGHIALGHLAGSARDDLGHMFTYDYVPLFLGVGPRGEALGGWLWGEVVIGAHVDSLATNGDREWSVGFGVAINAGVDVYHHGADRVGVYLGIESELQGDSYEGLSLGVAYRR